MELVTTFANSVGSLVPDLHRLRSFLYATSLSLCHAPQEVNLAAHFFA